MTLQDMIKQGAYLLQETHVPDYLYDAKELALEGLGLTSRDYLMNQREEVSQEYEKQYMQWIQRRANREPLQYILGKQNFYGYDFFVNKHVLIPRQDTENLVEQVIKRANKELKGKEINILDLCCGSGCIGLTLAKQLQAHVSLVDLSPEALSVAEYNNQQLSCNAEIIQSDLFTSVKGKYHIIVSNPPYIPTAVVEKLMPEVLEYEPRLALDGKEDGLYFYRCIIKEAENYLEENGYVFFEIGFDQADDIRKIFVEYGYTQVELWQDLAGLDRVMCGRKSRLGSEQIQEITNGKQ